jgi:hypothetical protein
VGITTLSSKAKQVTAHKNGNATIAKNISDWNTVIGHGRSELKKKYSR